MSYLLIYNSGKKLVAEALSRGVTERDILNEKQRVKRSEAKTPKFNQNNPIFGLFTLSDDSILEHYEKLETDQDLSKNLYKELGKWIYFQVKDKEKVFLAEIVEKVEKYFESKKL